MTIIDNIIIIVFLLVTIIVGIIAGRGIKSVKDFAVGGKSFMTLTLIMTIFATYMDGEALLNRSTLAFESGIAVFLIPLSDSICMILSGIIATRINNYRNAISAGDIMKELYGPYSQVFTGIAGFLMSMAFVALQFKALSFVFNYFYGVNPNLGVWLSALILIAYSSFGGVKAVTWTDVVQFFVLIHAVPLVASVAVNKTGGIFSLFHQLPAAKLSFDLPPKTIATYITFFLAVSIPLLSPPMVQRMLMSHSPEQAKRSYYLSALISIPFFFIVILTGLAGYVLMPNVNPNEIYLAIIDGTLPIGVKGFAVAGLLAVIMSSADSFMNTAAVSISHDFCKPLIGHKLTDKTELVITKVTTLATGLIACYTAMQYDTILELMLYSYILWGPVVSIPLIAGVFGFQGPKYAFYASMFAGAGTAIIWDLFDLEAATLMGGLLPALFANFITFVICYRIGGSRTNITA